MLQFKRLAAALAVTSACSLWGQVVHLGDGPTAPPSRSSKTAPSALSAPFAGADWYDTSNRETVRNAYNNVYVPTFNSPMGYVGDPASGVAGDTSAAYKNAVLTRVNFFRAMGGVPSISGFDPVRNSKDQQAALMMYANGALNHTPPTNWLRYTAAGAEAAGKSNLCQAALSDTGCLTGYMDDFGSNNTVVGHRRWILYPQTQMMGTGDLPGGNNLWNALWTVEDSTVWNGRPQTRDSFVAWPPKGYVPYQLLYNRWSFHYANANFAGAAVSVTRNGSPVTARIDATVNASLSAPENGIIFVLDNLQTSQPSSPSKPTADTTYTVSITNVLISGVPQSFTYNVIVFDPATSTGPVGPGTPAVISLTPGSGSGYTGTFTSTFTQSSGNHYLGYTLFLPTPNIVQYTATGSCLIEYNKYSNGIRLINNAGDNWLGPISGVPIAPGAQTLTNNQCSVDVSKVVANVNGSTMTVTLPVTFFSALGPVLSTFLQAQDDKGVWTGMTQFGNWLLPGAAQTRLGPTISSVGVSNTSGAQATYTVTASHTAGVNSLFMVHLLAGASIVGSPVCQIVYFHGINALNMINDAGNALVSASNITVGQPGSLSNSRCSLNTALTSRTQSTNSVSVVLPVVYNTATFAGQKYVLFNAFDNAGLLSHWVLGGTMNVQ